MKLLRPTLLALMLLLGKSPTLSAADITLKLTKRYLNLPVAQSEARNTRQFSLGGKTERSFKIRLATGKPESWVFCDMAAYKGKTLTISYPGNAAGLSQIYQADKIHGQNLLYAEIKRP
ncbi:MAG: hypothetical protein ACO1OF_12695 [Adhaeribacter sp.]